jgi:ribose transport system substrate-binding protein
MRVNRKSGSRRHRLVRRMTILVSMALSLGGVVDMVSAATTSATSTASGVATAKERFDATLRVPKLVTSSAPHFNASKVRGKNVWIVEFAEAGISPYWVDPIQTALEKYGAHVTIFNANYEATEANRGIAEALSDGANAIVMISTDPKYVSKEISAAKAKGVPVIATTDGNPSATKNADYVPGVKAEVSYDYLKVGELEADWFISDSKGKGHALFISSPDENSSLSVTKGFKDEVSSLCPDCQVTVKPVATSQAETVLPTLVSSTLRADPSIDYIVPDYDFQVPLIVSELKQSNLTAKVRIGSWNAEPNVMELLQEPTSGVDMDLGAPNGWFGDAIADATMRQLTGAPVFNWGGQTSNFMGFRSFTPTNAAKVNVSTYNDERLYGVSGAQVNAAFAKIWGAP